MVIRTRAAAFLFILSVASLSLAQTTRPSDTGIDKAYLQAHFFKTEYRVPMRDGVHLHTAVYVPKGGLGKYPILFIRTPYGVGGYGENEWPDPKAELKWFGREPFIFALQDVRGRFHSGGTFLHVRPVGEASADDFTDAYDTIDWLTKNVPQNTGRVALVGMSYPGFYTLAGMVNAHPALKCAIPQAPIGDWFVGDDIHRNGALNLAASYLFLRSVAANKDPLPTPDGYDFFLKLGAPGNAKDVKDNTGFWDDAMAHGTYDAWWKARVGPHLTNIHVPTMVVGGWFDAEDLFGTFAAYHEVERRNPGIENNLVMGPWSHGLWIRGDGESLGDLHFGAKTAEWYRATIELPFLKHHLTSDGPGTLAEAVVFETGANVWRRFAAWPPTEAEERELHLGAHGRLSLDASPNGAEQFDEYVSDPARPVPYVGGITMNVPKEYMSADQRFASQRPDVLVYQTDVLTDDLRLAGPIAVDLRVSTTGTDSDWVVKLIDVYPDNEKDPDPNPTGVHLGEDYQQLVRGDIMRGKFRDGFDKPVPFTPGQVTPVTFDTPDICHTFKRGHRVMIQIQSSWFPLFDRNPQTLCDIYHAKPDDYRKATQRIYRNSTIRVGVLPNIRG